MSIRKNPTLTTNGNEDIDSVVSALVPAVTEGVVTALRSMRVISPIISDSESPEQTADSSTQVPLKDNSGITELVTSYRVIKCCISSEKPLYR